MQRFLISGLVFAFAIAHCAGQLAFDASSPLPDTEPTTNAGKDTTTATPSPDTTTATSTTVSTTTVVTTPAPTELPSQYTRGQWIVNEGNNTGCVRMEMKLEFVVEYTKTDTTKANVTLMLPGTHNLTGVAGICHTTDSDQSDRHNSITIPWQGEDDWNVIFDFILPNSQSEYYCEKVTFTFGMTEKHFPNISTPVESLTSVYANASLYKVDEANSWQCESNVSASGFEDAQSAVKLMYTEDLQVEAFSKNLDQGFSDAIPCPEDTEVSTIVPIAVGAALAALVVIVLIAYIIGRRRNKRGYESV